LQYISDPSPALPTWSDQEVSVVYFNKISNNSITKEYGEMTATT